MGKLRKRRCALAYSPSAEARFRSFEEVFSFLNLLLSADRCIQGNGTSWKRGVKSFRRNLYANVFGLWQALATGKYRQSKPKTTYKTERSKKRKISALAYKDKIVQRCFCDYCLVPILSSKLIWDSAATLKGGGPEFTLERLRKKIMDCVFQNPGQEIFGLTMDFHSYFELIDRSILKFKVRKAINDARLADLYDYFVDNSSDRGLGLGSHISQISALFFVNDLDQYIKRELKAPFYIRYMDDAVIFSPDRDFLVKIKGIIREKCEEINIELNEKKTFISAMSKGIVFLQRRFFIENGKLKSVPRKDSAARLVRRFKKVAEDVTNGVTSPESLYPLFQVWASHFMKDDSNELIKRTRGKLLKIVRNIPEGVLDAMDPYDHGLLLGMPVSPPRKGKKDVPMEKNVAPIDTFGLLNPNATGKRKKKRRRFRYHRKRKWRSRHVNAKTCPPPAHSGGLGC